MFGSAKKRREKRKAARTEQLLRFLSDSPEAFKPMTALGKTTGLGTVVFPLLAELARRGLVEHRWLDGPDGPRLAYRLSPAGRDYLNRPWQRQPVYTKS